MTAAPALAAVAEDFLYCLGLGLLLAALRDASGLIFGNGRVLGFVWDVAAFVAAAVALCGFAAGASAAGLTRWYMAAGLALGALSWHGAVSGALHAAAFALLIYLRKIIFIRGLNIFSYDLQCVSILYRLIVIICMQVITKNLP